MPRKHKPAMPATLLPAEARKRWVSSEVPRPMAKCRDICDRHPDETREQHMARCIKAGVAKATASVACSRWRRAKGLIS